MQGPQKVTLEEASVNILEKIEERTEKEFSEKWKGKTEMVLYLAIPIVIMHGFGMPEKLEDKYRSFEPSILSKYKDIIFEVEELILEATEAFRVHGLSERQASAESKVQVFQFIGRKIPSNLAIDIMHMVNS